jgi:hypothetical protein
MHMPHHLAQAALYFEFVVIMAVMGFIFPERMAVMFL